MVETIKVRNLPAEMVGTYDAKGRVHTITTVTGLRATRMVSESEFEFSGPMRLVATLMKGAFLKQKRTYLENFRRFAETGEAARPPVVS